MADQTKATQQQATPQQAQQTQKGAAQKPAAPATPGTGAVTISNCSHHCNCCCLPKPPVKKKVVLVKKAAPVLTSAEIDRMIDLGLGRGIDATSPKPWAHKSAFQVRRVTAEGVIGTEEGGSLQSYEREVSSVVSHQTNMKASVIVPQAPVEIGMDAEQSRSVSSTRRTLGKKVVNRSISFLSDFSDVPVVNAGDQDQMDIIRRKWNAHGGGPPDSAAVGSSNVQEAGQDLSVADMHYEFLTFEQRLSKWIVKRILQRQERMARDLRAAEQPVLGKPKFVIDTNLSMDPTSVFCRFVYASNEEEKRKIIHDCYDFVQHFRITHYVSSIELGAVEYRVFSETDFNSTIGAGGALAVEKLVSLSFSHKRTTRKFKKASDVKTIGKMSAEGKVGRGTHDEAVVGIKVQPISTLVKTPYLQLALQRSLVYYMDEQGDTSSGPFLIAFGSERSLKYWSVTDDYRIYGTSGLKNASLFFIISSDGGKHPYEFHISYMGDNRHVLKKRVSSLTPLSQKSVETIPRYLNAEVSVFGTNTGPLSLEYHVSGRSRLLLFGRVANEKGPVSPTTWTQGRDMFFINCARRQMKRDGYVAMRRRRRRGQEEWVSGCLPRKHSHNEDSVLMLFRLLPASLRDMPSLTDGGPDGAGPAGLSESGTPFDDLYSRQTLDEQLEQFGRGSVPDAFRAPPSPLPQPRSGRKVRVAGEEEERRDALSVPELLGLSFPLLDTATTLPATHDTQL